MGETQRVVKARGVTPGRATGLMLLSGRPFMFAHGVEPSTAKVTDIRSDILGKNVKGKVLVFPTGKGSTTGSAWLLEAIRQGNGPVAIINAETEPIVATALIMARLLYGVTIPLVDRPEEGFPGLFSTGRLVTVDGDNGLVSLD